MPRDYAKPTTMNKGKGATGKKPWRWFFTGMLLGMGLMVGGYLYVTMMGLQQSKTLLAKLNPEKTAKPKRKPIFDYYSILPEMKVPGEDEHVTKTQTVKQHSESKDYFMIQAASFSKKQEADRMKAELLLSGYTASIKLFHKGHADWYRVMLGPYNDASQARFDQKRLSDNKIDTLLITVHPLKNEKSIPM